MPSLELHRSSALVYMRQLSFYQVCKAFVTPVYVVCSTPVVSMDSGR